VTIELDDDLAAQAASNLRRAGYPDVRVTCGDGALGDPSQAPYDRIIVTAEAWDLVPAWWDQLTPDGRIVAPVRLHGSGLTRSIGFRRAGPGTLASESAAVCGSVPMRGIAEHAGQRIQLAPDAVLKVDAADLPDAPALAQVLAYPGGRALDRHPRPPRRARRAPRPVARHHDHRRQLQPPDRHPRSTRPRPGQPRHALGWSQPLPGRDPRLRHRPAS
jgi:hypothetical protein